jgi:hypothetical protein
MNVPSLVTSYLVIDQQNEPNEYPEIFHQTLF